MKKQAPENEARLTDPEVLAKLSRLVLRARGVVEGSFSGIHRSHNKGSSVEFAQYRKYTPGDDISRLDWKVLARTDRFFVKEFEADTNMRCHIILDSSGSMGFAGQGGIPKIAVARKMAATIAQLAVMQGDAAGLQCFSEKVSCDIPARNNPRHLKNIFDTILSVEPKGRTDIVSVLHSLAEKIRRRALVILISDLFTDDLDGLLDCFQHMRHRKHDLSVFHLMDRQELEFEFDRPVRFKDMESGAFIQTDPAHIRRTYLAELASFVDKIRKGCLEYKVDYRFADVSTPYEEQIRSFMLSRMRRK
jgi:uncharacterized protein (DUF58 family)